MLQFYFQSAYQMTLAASLEKVTRTSSGAGLVEVKHNSNILTSKEETSEKETRS